MAKALSSQKNANAAGCLIPFFSVFALFGGVAFFAAFIQPLRHYLSTQNWVATPCRIEVSTVVAKRSSKSTTYAPDVLYSYTFNGQNYSSSQFDSFPVSTSNQSAALAQIAPYSVGSSAQCYVNPGAPNKAVLSRSLPVTAWLSLIPLLFTGIGVGGVVWQLRALANEKRNLAQAASAWQAPDTSTTVYGAAGPSLSTQDDAFSPANTGVPSASDVILKPTSTRTAGCLWMAFFAAMWNGITWVGMFASLRESGSWFIVLFLLIFVAVGLVLLWAAFSSFLQMFNARVEIALPKNGYAPGETIPLSWNVRGGRLPSALTLTLEGREEAIYQRGTDTITDKAIFYSQEITRATDAFSINSGTVSTQVPAGMMHSLAASNNKIIWSLKVKGEVALWPDIDEEYPLLIVPATS